MFTRVFYQSLASMWGASAKGYRVKTYKGDMTSKSNLYEYIADMPAATGNFCTGSKTSTSVNRCVAFGTGDAPVTLDDYVLSGDHITAYSATYVQTLNEGLDTCTLTYHITNKSSEAFTIKEVGIYCGTSYSYSVLMYREVLDSPVTIQPSGVGQVTITLKVNIPE